MLDLSYNGFVQRGFVPAGKSLLPTERPVCRRSVSRNPSAAGSVVSLGILHADHRSDRIVALTARSTASPGPSTRFQATSATHPTAFCTALRPGAPDTLAAVSFERYGQRSLGAPRALSVCAVVRFASGARPSPADATVDVLRDSPCMSWLVICRPRVDIAAHPHHFQTFSDGADGRNRPSSSPTGYACRPSLACG